jgi:hypothetical protein
MLTVARGDERSLSDLDLDQGAAHACRQGIGKKSHVSPEKLMHRLALVSLSALVLSCAFGTSPAHAGRYCLQGDQWGYPGNCAFDTYEQCRVTASGTRSSCGINPHYAHRKRVTH